MTLALQPGVSEPEPAMSHRLSAALIALPFAVVGCGDIQMPDETDVGGSPRGLAPATADVVVVHFETKKRAPDVAGSPRDTDVAQLALDSGPSNPDSEEAGPEASPPEPDRPRPDPASRWLVHDGRLVLAHGDEVDAAWSSAPAKLKQSGDPAGDGLFLAERRVDATALPLEFVALAGAELKVYDREREVCVARVGATPRLTAELVHLPDEWVDEGEEARVPEHDGADVFEMGRAILSIPLEPLIGDCDPGIWAAPLAAPTPGLYREVAHTKRFERKVIAAFRALPAWRQAQREMQTYYDDINWRRSVRSQRWDTLYGSEPEVVRYQSQHGEREIAMVHADSVDGCGSEGQRLVSLFEVSRSGKRVKLTEIVSVPWADRPLGLVDRQGDGVLELYMPTGSRSTLIERWRPPEDDEASPESQQQEVELLQIPDITAYGCPC